MVFLLHKGVYSPTKTPSPPLKSNLFSRKQCKPQRTGVHHLSQRADGGWYVLECEVRTWSYCSADPAGGSQAQPRLWWLCWSLSARNAINLFRAGSGGEPAIHESSARGKARRMNDWLALPEKSHPTAQTEGDWDCELCRRAGENCKPAEEKQSSFVLLWDTSWSSLPAGHGHLLKETDPKWQQKAKVLRVLKQRSPQKK